MTSGYGQATPRGRRSMATPLSGHLTKLIYLTDYKSMSVNSARRSGAEPVAGLAAEVTGAAAPAAEALLLLALLARRLACPSSREPSKPASAPFLSRRHDPLAAARPAQHAASAAARR